MSACDNYVLVHAVAPQPLFSTGTESVQSKGWRCGRLSGGPQRASLIQALHASRSTLKVIKGARVLPLSTVHLAHPEGGLADELSCCGKFQIVVRSSPVTRRRSARASIYIKLASANGTVRKHTPTPHDIPYYCTTLDRHSCSHCLHRYVARLVAWSPAGVLQFSIGRFLKVVSLRVSLLRVPRWKGSWRGQLNARRRV